MENYKILLVEDDGSLIDGLEYSLKKMDFWSILPEMCRNSCIFTRRESMTCFF